MLAFSSGKKRKRLKNEDTPETEPPDYWKHIGANLECDKSSRTILTVNKLRQNGYNAGFGAVTVNKGRHMWKVKIMQKTTKMCIGVSSSSEAINDNFQRKKAYPTYAYNWDGSKISYNTKYQPYGKEIKTGQTITVILNLDHRTISFMNEHENMGVAFRDILVGETILYRLAVSVVDKNDSVHMIGYGQLNDGDTESESDGDSSLMNHFVDVKEESEEIMDLNINNMEIWNDKMCKQWIKNTVNKQMNEMNGKDLFKLMDTFQHEKGIFDENERIRSECNRLSKDLQSLQLKMNKLTKKNAKLAKKLDEANNEKDGLLSLYEMKEEEVSIAQIENQRLRTQLFQLQKSLTQE